MVYVTFSEMFPFWSSDGGIYDTAGKATKKDIFFSMNLTCIPPRGTAGTERQTDKRRTKG